MSLFMKWTILAAASFSLLNPFEQVLNFCAYYSTVKSEENTTNEFDMDTLILI